MTTLLSQPAAPLLPDTDIVQPFQLDRSNLRGRMVRTGPLLDTILGRHAYPAAVAHLLAETITLTATLAAALKYEGVFTLQTKGDGPVRLMVADVTSGGDVRGYAQFAEDLGAAGDTTEPHLPTLLGKGYLAFTVDQGEHTQRYQGIVALTGDRLDDSVRHYFSQSEQLATGILVNVGRDADGHWEGGAIMLQALPEEDAATSLDAKPSHVEDDWRRAMALLSTATPEELRGSADADGRRLGINEVLFRLFHEEEVRVYDRHALRPGCRCSRERVASVLGTIPRAELADLRVDGAVEVTCEFCSQTYRFQESDLDAVYAQAEDAAF